MTINNVLSFAVFSRLTSSNDDILSDRVNHLYTVFILLIFTIIVGVKQFVGDPIQCLLPHVLTPAQNAYTLSLCWIKNTYYVDFTNILPHTPEEKDAHQLLYYQWVPIILLFMAFLFKLPYVLWRLLAEVSGFNVSSFVSLAVHAQYAQPEKHDERLKHMSDYLDRWLEFNRKVVKIPPRNASDKQRYLTFDGAGRWYILLLYLFIKLLYCINVLAQFFILNTFLGSWFTMYGTEFLNKLIKGEPWAESIHFPLVTMCDFQVRDQQNVYTYTTQCVLPINLFSEKIFLFIWFWLVCVAVMSIISFCKWTSFIIFAGKRITFVQDYLNLLNILCGEQEKSHVKKFVLDYLKGDGFFILKMLESNCGPIVMADVVKHLWYLYKIRPLPGTAQPQF